MVNTNAVKVWNVTPELRGPLYDQLRNTLKLLCDEFSFDLNYKSSKPNISIILTAYNCEKYIEKSIRSLQVQSFKKIEIIVVDDCSTDNTALLVKKMQLNDNRIKYYKTFKNSGTYVAKNIGLLEAIGEYVTFQDSDDISDKERLTNQFDAFNSDENIIATTCEYARIDELTGALILNRGEQSRPGLISLMIKRKIVLDKIGLFDSVRINADDEYKTRIKKYFGKKSILEISKCYYYALMRDEGLTGSGHAENNLTQKIVKNFLAPVRQRYTDNFLKWHDENTRSRENLFMDFPGFKRKFHAPISIDPFKNLRADKLSIILLNENEKIIKSDSFSKLESSVRRSIFSFYLISDDENMNGSVKLISNLNAEEKITLPIYGIKKNENENKIYKEIFDHIGDGVVLVANDFKELQTVNSKNFRFLIYKLFTFSNILVLMSDSDGVAGINLNGIDVSSLKMDKLPGTSKGRFLNGMRKNNINVSIMSVI